MGLSPSEFLDEFRGFAQNRRWQGARSARRVRYLRALRPRYKCRRWCTPGSASSTTEHASWARRASRIRWCWPRRLPAVTGKLAEIFQEFGKSRITAKCSPFSLYRTMAFGIHPRLYLPSWHLSTPRRGVVVRTCTKRRKRQPRISAAVNNGCKRCISHLTAIAAIMNTARWRLARKKPSVFSKE